MDIVRILAVLVLVGGIVRLVNSRKPQPWLSKRELARLDRDTAQRTGWADWDKRPWTGPYQSNS